MSRVFRRLKIWTLCKLNLAVDIGSKAKWPVYVLSNSYSNPFEIDGVKCRSMENFLQSLTCCDEAEQLSLCCSDKTPAAICADNPNADSTRLFWHGKSFDRRSGDYRRLLNRAYWSMFDQCPEFREALAATGRRRLYHSSGMADVNDAMITTDEFCNILMWLRQRIVY